MTNISSGSKRPWDGVESDAYKRHREREEPRDWRDVHLKSPSSRKAPRRGSVDRRVSSDYGSHGRHSRGLERRRSSDYGKDKVRKDDRERDRERPARKEDGRAGDVRRGTPPNNRDHRHTNGHSQAAPDSEKEEGE
jgi:serine/threonine-protein kinase PRP4